MRRHRRGPTLLALSESHLSLSYPSPDDFRTWLNNRPLRDLAVEHVLTGEPFAFRDDAEALEQLTGHIGERLGIDSTSIRVIGSGRIGFSLNPANFPRPFRPASDIDVAVVNDDLFDRVWHTMLAWNYPRRFRLYGEERRWQRSRQDDLYWGWFRPDKIRYKGLAFPEILRPLRDLSTQWFDAFQSLSTYPALAARVVAGRLYRTQEHAIGYHIDGLRKLRDQLSDKED